MQDEKTLECQFAAESDRAVVHTYGILYMYINRSKRLHTAKEKKKKNLTEMSRKRKNKPAHTTNVRAVANRSLL